MIHGLIMQGTTPTHSFELPFNTNLIKKLSITYVQNGNIIIKKHIEDCQFDKNVVMVRLTQTDTLEFTPNSKVDIQFKVMDFNGSVTISDILTVNVDEVLDKEAFEDEI